jgi:very-short-patch-repair endonuclease
MDLERWWHEMHDMDGFRDIGSVDEAIAHVAGRLGGVIDRAQLDALGVARGAIAHRLASGRLRRQFHGVYAVGHEALPELGRLAAGVLAAGRGTVLSHGSAAALWKLLPSMPQFVEVTTTDRRPRSRPGLVVHTAETIEARLLGLPVTTPLRTLKDLPQHHLERAASEALVLKLVTHQQLKAQGGRLARLVVGPTRSALERAFLKAVLNAGLPAPLTNHRIGPYTVDFYWPSHHLVVETDGSRYHDHELARRRDRRKDDELQLRGCTVLRVDDIPAGVANVVRVLSRPATRTAP